MDELRKKNTLGIEQEVFNTGKTKIIITEHFPKNGKTLPELFKDFILRDVKIAS